MMFLTRLGDLTMDDVGGMLFVLMGVMAVICVVSLFILKMKDAENDTKPVLGMRAKIIDKDHVAPGTVAFVIGVTFETEDGNRMEISCNAREHYVVGDTGFLKWQGTRLISFERDK